MGNFDKLKVGPSFVAMEELENFWEGVPRERDFERRVGADDRDLAIEQIDV